MHTFLKRHFKGRICPRRTFVKINWLKLPASQHNTNTLTDSYAFFRAYLILLQIRALSVSTNNISSNSGVATMLVCPNYGIVPVYILCSLQDEEQWPCTPLTSVCESCMGRRCLKRCPLNGNIQTRLQDCCK